MDSTQGQSGESSQKKDETSGISQDQGPQESKPAETKKLTFSVPKIGGINLGSGEKFYMPKFQMPNFREKLSEYGRVLKVTKKPDMPEFKTIVKASGLGIIIVGVIGFIVAIIAQLITEL